MNGLYIAIYYNDHRLLDKYKQRSDGVKFLISPDYSLFNDLHKAEQYHRIFKARVVALWLVLELGEVVIPNISCVSESSFATYFAGLEKSSVVAFSTKGHIRSDRERQLLKNVVKYLVDNFPNLEKIIVYSVCGNDQTSLKLFNYATEHGIDVIIPDNTLRSRNKTERESYERK